jgi:dTDP-4-dehydrorhamnose 3,5-epimerase
MIVLESTDLAGVHLLHANRYSDERGMFVRTWCAYEFEAVGIRFQPVQANMSWTKAKATIRGMHFQRSPRPQAKLVRCSRGRIWDVVTDLRPDSPTFGRSFGLELSEESGTALHISAGFAHGFQALTDDVTVEYLMDEVYVGELADGFCYNDPDAAIDWPLPAGPVLKRDRNWSSLRTREFWCRVDDLVAAR